eukprot:5017035-Pleurochrysis_carterae.AAC.2
MYGSQPQCALASPLACQHRKHGDSQAVPPTLMRDLSLLCRSARLTTLPLPPLMGLASLPAPILPDAKQQLQIDPRAVTTSCGMLDDVDSEDEEDDAIAADQSKYLSRISNPKSREAWIKHYRRVQKFKRDNQLAEEQRDAAAVVQQQHVTDPLAQQGVVEPDNDISALDASQRICLMQCVPDQREVQTTLAQHRKQLQQLKREVQTVAEQGNSDQAAHKMGKPKGLVSPITPNTPRQSLAASPLPPSCTPAPIRPVRLAKPVSTAFDTMPLRGRMRPPRAVYPTPPLLPQAASFSMEATPKQLSPATVTPLCYSNASSLSGSRSSWNELDENEIVGADDSDCLPLPADGSPFFKIYDPVGPNRKTNWLKQIQQARSKRWCQSVSREQLDEL